LVQKVGIYAIAAVIVWYAARGVSWSQVVAATGHATLWLFIGASLGGFLCYVTGETILYSRLFNYFYGPTTPRELLPTMAAFYFFQLVSSNVASGAFLLFLHARKRVPWLTGVCTLLFQSYLDVTLLALLSVIAIALVPTTPIRPGLNYAVAVLGASSLIATFWLFWGAWLGVGSWLRWLYERPSMVIFRTARLSHYIRLMSIRFMIFLGVGFAIYGQLMSFHIRVPLVQALALTPFIVAIGDSPLSPGGIGTTQLVFTMGFGRFAGKGDLFALSLAISAFNLLVRTPMGLAMRTPLVEATEDVKCELATQLKAGQG
jgi:hypothetical protein